MVNARRAFGACASSYRTRLSGRSSWKLDRMVSAVEERVSRSREQDKTIHKHQIDRQSCSIHSFIHSYLSPPELSEVPTNPMLS
jgi:hypothetical protein